MPKYCNGIAMLEKHIKKYIKMKNLLIEGHQGSGKTDLSRKITALFKNKEVVYIPKYLFTNDYPFVFQMVTKKTKIIVIDEICLLDELFLLRECLSADEIVINRKMKKRFNTKVNFILVCDFGGLSFEEIKNALPNNFNVIMFKQKVLQKHCNTVKNEL